jgi:hypothetical protein
MVCIKIIYRVTAVCMLDLTEGCFKLEDCVTRLQTVENFYASIECTFL